MSRFLLKNLPPRSRWRNRYAYPEPPCIPSSSFLNIDVLAQAELEAENNNLPFSQEKQETRTEAHSEKQITREPSNFSDSDSSQNSEPISESSPKVSSYNLKRSAARPIKSSLSANPDRRRNSDFLLQNNLGNNLSKPNFHKSTDLLHQVHFNNQTQSILFQDDVSKTALNSHMSPLPPRTKEKTSLPFHPLSDNRIRSLRRCNSSCNSSPLAGGGLGHRLFKNSPQVQKTTNINVFRPVNLLPKKVEFLKTKNTPPKDNLMVELEKENKIREEVHGLSASSPLRPQLKNQVKNRPANHSNLLLETNNFNAPKDQNLFASQTNRISPILSDDQKSENSDKNMDKKEEIDPICPSGDGRSQTNNHNDSNYFSQVTQPTNTRSGQLSVASPFPVSKLNQRKASCDYLSIQYMSENLPKFGQMAAKNLAQKNLKKSGLQKSEIGISALTQKAERIKMSTPISNKRPGLIENQINSRANSSLCQSHNASFCSTHNNSILNQTGYLKDMEICDKCGHEFVCSNSYVSRFEEEFVVCQEPGSAIIGSGEFGKVYAARNRLDGLIYWGVWGLEKIFGLKIE